jgi:hypothetical protein
MTVTQLNGAWVGSALTARIYLVTPRMPRLGDGLGVDDWPVDEPADNLEACILSKLAWGHAGDFSEHTAKMTLAGEAQLNRNLDKQSSLRD